MRLWSIHPKYLDAIGLVALWRESLLAQKVLEGETRGYKFHPQLRRFKNHPFPLKAIANYLTEIWEESNRRGYNFNKEKIGAGGAIDKIKISRAELRSEFDLLSDRLKRRNTPKYLELVSVKTIECHPLLEVEED